MLLQTKELQGLLATNYQKLERQGRIASSLGFLKGAWPSLALDPISSTQNVENKFLLFEVT